MRNTLKTNALSALAAVCLLALPFCKNDKGHGVQTSKGSDDPNATVSLPMNPDGTVDTTKVAKMVFEQPIFEFDTVKAGEVLKHSFKFKNTGPVPLVISDARSSCGCTVPEWPKEAIAPGGSGEISAKFNTAGKSGNQTKIVRVTGNIYPTPAEVRIKGYVIGKDGGGDN